MPAIFGAVNFRKRLEVSALPTIGWATARESIEHDRVQFFRETNGKFLKQKIFFNSEKRALMLDGVITNASQLIRKYSACGFDDLIDRLISLHGETFFTLFRGSFVGALTEHEKGVTTFFVDPLSTIPMFYFQEHGQVVFSSRLAYVSSALREMEHRSSIDIQSAYYLLTYGFMLRNSTLLTDVKKLPAGCYGKVNGESLEIVRYHKFGGRSFRSENETSLIEEADELFSQAVRNQFQTNEDQGYWHLTTLSGGLDSRMTLVTAHDLGFQTGTCITFSENDYLDEKLAKQIASDLGLEFLFYSMNGGGYLIDHWAPALTNDALITYAGAAHVLAALRCVSSVPFGMIHMGTLGDAILGTYIADPEGDRVQPLRGARSKRFVDYLTQDLNSLSQEYESNEIFKLYNRGVNGIMNGNWSAREFFEPVSPFLDQEFVEFCLQVPRELRFRHKFYIDWIRRKHPIAARYRWERTGLSIRHYLRWEKASRAVLKIKRELLGKRLYSMNPFEYWYRNNVQLRTALNSSVHKDRALGLKDSHLRVDVLEVLENGNLLEKAQAITLLNGIDLHLHGRVEWKEEANLVQKPLVGGGGR